MRFAFPGLLMTALLISTAPVEAADSKLDSPFGFVVNIPEGWSAAQSDNPSAFSAHYFSGPGGSYISIKVTDPKPELKQKEALDYSMKKTRLFQPKSVSINKLRWVKTNFEFKNDQTWEVIFTTFKNKRFYHFNFGGAKKDFNTLNVVIDGIMNSVVFSKSLRPKEMKRPGAKVKGPPQPLQPKKETPKVLPKPLPLPGNKNTPVKEPEPLKEPEPQPLPEPAVKEPDVKEPEIKKALVV